MAEQGNDDSHATVQCDLIVITMLTVVITNSSTSKIMNHRISFCSNLHYLRLC